MQFKSIFFIDFELEPYRYVTAFALSFQLISGYAPTLFITVMSVHCNMLNKTIIPAF